VKTSRPLIGIPLTPRDEANEAPGAVQSLWRKYAKTIHASGGLPLCLPILAHAGAEEFLHPLDGLLLPGGGDVDPALFGEERHPDLGTVVRDLDDFEIALTLLALERGMPVLGICRGAQVLNVALGGTLIQHIPGQVAGALKHSGNPPAEPVHAIEVPAASLLARILGTGRHMVNSTHHQAVKDLAPGLRISATCPDDGVIEAVEDPDARFLLGVQFHPEEMPDRFAALFEAFVEACREPCH